MRARGFGIEFGTNNPLPRQWERVASEREPVRVAAERPVKAYSPSSTSTPIALSAIAKSA